MATIQVNDDNFDEKVLKAQKPVMVDFYADWCGPCKAAAPVIETLAEEYQGKLLVAKLDVDANPKIASQHQVMSIPTVIFFKDGQEVDRQIGFSGREKYEEGIKKIA